MTNDKSITNSRGGRRVGAGRPKGEEKAQHLILLSKDISSKLKTVKNKSSLIEDLLKKHFSSKA